MARRKKDTNEYDVYLTVAIATMKDNTPTDIQEYYGTKSECTTFLNNEIYTRTINDFMDCKIVIKLDTKEDWHTLNELQELGVIELE